MEKEKILKIVGACMCVPLVCMIVYLVMNPSIWVVALLTALFSFMFSYGFKLVKGASLADIKEEIIEDAESIKNGVENLKD